MGNKRSPAQYIMLFLPWMLAFAFQENPILSYLTAWLGSFFIFYITLTGKIKPLPDDRSIANQLMRPIFLVQLIFAGYMCCTSIFYFFDVLGYVNFKKVEEAYLLVPERLKLTARCQHYYCLAHASFATGLLAFMRQPLKPKYQYQQTDLLKLLLNIALITVFIANLLRYINGLSQFSHQLNTLSAMASTLALALAIPQRERWIILVCIVLYGINFYHAVISGFKEPIILSILVLGIFLYPNYKRSVLVIFIPLLLLMFMLLPTYNRIFREHAWSGNATADEASEIALQLTLNNNDADQEGIWPFLAYRLSEIDMFSKYVQSTPTFVDYYGFQLIWQSVRSVLPRVLWPSKPITEQLVMERVYQAGVVSRSSVVSAKPAFIADAYLSGGIPAIVASLFLYGALCQIIANTAEKLFGGYVLGTAFIFTSLFRVFWRGQSFEFLFNTVCWSYVTMYLIFWALRAANILKPDSSDSS